MSLLADGLLMNRLRAAAKAGTFSMTALLRLITEMDLALPLAAIKSQIRASRVTLASITHCLIIRYFMRLIPTGLRAAALTVK